MRVSWLAVVLSIVTLTGCIDAAETPYRACEAAQAKGDVKAAVASCEAASSASPASKFGVLATEKRKQLQPALDKVLADEKAAAEKKAEADKIAAAQKAKAEAAAAAAAQAAAEERAKALRAKITKKYWDTEPDGGCTGKGLPPYKWDYTGGTYAEDRELAVADGCSAAHTYAENTSYCCPQKPITVGW